MSDPTSDEIREIERFLYDEAWLLDSRRYEEWLGLFAEDLRYWMPTRRTVAKSAVNASTSVEEELVGEHGIAWFDETLVTLLARVMRLRGGIAWAEDPPSRTRRLITNIHVSPGKGRASTPCAATSCSIAPGISPRGRPSWAHGRT